MTIQTSHQVVIAWENLKQTMNLKGIGKPPHQKGVVFLIWYHYLASCASQGKPLYR